MRGRFYIARTVPEGYYEHEIAKFSGAMLHQLRLNEHVGDWNSWRPTEEELELAMSQAWVRLKQVRAAGGPNSKRRVQELSADIANYAFKAFQIYGS